MVKSVETDKILDLLQQAKTEFKKIPNCNMSNIGNLIKEMKIMLTEFPSMSLNSKEYDITELIIARDVLELSVLMCAVNEDYSGFERDFLNLQRLYIDFYEIIPTSENQNMIRGLHLLFLLCNDRIGDFHLSLENIPIIDREDILISSVRDIEHHLMDGNYNKIMQLQNNLPSPYYKSFYKHLTNTCREKVAKCIECSFDRISINKLKDMMKFSSNEELISFINRISQKSASPVDENISSKIQWKLIDNVVYFEREVKRNTTNLDLISNSLGYALEFERIV
ncbi:proteasome regulatory subunit Rpn12 family [Cryptosporidium ryanae]|uniref:proteasome regulatory subunit Rpn12 family n=1 Tax=Cryptosporidium ryanae TaxID=515981 RepID=UPI00351AA508|nr:proteasome regulatory subunit Rpn12 family [Cryptosporidium ryanae]